MMATDTETYPGVDQDEEEKLKDGYPAVAPPGMYDPMSSPPPVNVSQMPPAPTPQAPAQAAPPPAPTTMQREPGDTGLVKRGDAMAQTPAGAPPPATPPKPVGPAPNWAQYAPPAPSKLARVGQGVAEFIQPSLRNFFDAPKVEAQQAYENATRQHEQEVAEQQKAEAQKSTETLQASEAKKNEAQAGAVAGGNEKTKVTDSKGVTHEIYMKDLEKFIQEQEKEAGAGERNKDTNTTHQVIAAGNNKTAEDVARERATAAQNVARGHDLVSSENARLRASTANNPDTLTATMKTMKQQAQVTLPSIDKALDETEKVAGRLGPVEGRWNEFWQGKVGADDPQYAHYKDEIGMVSTAVTLAHARGRMSNELFEHFQQMFDAGKQSPENMIQALNVAKEWLGTYAQMGEHPSATGGGNASETQVHAGYEYTKGEDGQWHKGNKVQ